ncbi:uncharacterized protein LOC111086750, partial [Limulus polyphemus]|uniref:Uncharacterized protein LOC111086750 n=1 Tax=Limulus polyphemus TaxID=6850 RepID=A0ABM1SSF7_LIMPO
MRSFYLLLFIPTILGTTNSPAYELEKVVPLLTGQTNSTDTPLTNSISAVLETLLTRIRCVQEGLTPLACVKCLTPSKMIRILAANQSSAVTTSSDLKRLSVVFINHVLTFRSVCTTIKRTNDEECKNTGACATKVLHRLVAKESSHRFVGIAERKITLLGIQDVLGEIKAVYEPRQRKTCFSAETLLEEIGTPNSIEEGLDVNRLEDLSGVLIKHMIEGDCIDVGESVNDFLDDIFQRYGDTSLRLIHEKGLDKLLSDLKIGSEHDHHGNLKNHHSETFNNSNYDNDHDHTEYNHDNLIIDQAPTSTNRPRTTQEITTVLTNISDSNQISQSAQEIPNHTFSSTSTHNMSSFNVEDLEKIPTFFLDSSVNGSADSSKQLVQRSRRTVNHDDHDHDIQVKQCWSSRALMEKFALRNKGQISRSEFLNLCPALIQQIVSDICLKKKPISSRSSNAE